VTSFYICFHFFVVIHIYHLVQALVVLVNHSLLMHVVSVVLFLVVELVLKSSEQCLIVRTIRHKFKLRLRLLL